MLPPISGGRGPGGEKACCWGAMFEEIIVGEIVSVTVVVVVVASPIGPGPDSIGGGPVEKGLGWPPLTNWGGPLTTGDIGLIDPKPPTPPPPITALPMTPPAGGPLRNLLPPNVAPPFTVVVVVPPTIPLAG